MARVIPVQAVEEPAASFYASERKVYPRDTAGKFQTLRTAAAVWLLGMFYLFPWLNWEGRQSVLFDLPARKFHVFGLTFWPQDFPYLALLLIIAALALFFFTALAGRLWCGYACPQTVWTEVFLWMERFTEGDRGRRMKLDSAPWGREKLLRKGAKHFLWLVFALWTGFTFVAFFTPARSLAQLEWGAWETFWIFFYALATWGNAGFLREQVCKYMCPYARFQSAMFDRNTLIIAYDPMRGEPRGPRKRGMASVMLRARGLLETATAYDFVFRNVQNADAAGNRPQGLGTITFDAAPATPLPALSALDLGDCIDCTICVQVCPTGIDIRNGLQYECIACGACVDACDQVMDKIGYPRGLIRNTTQNALDGKPSRILRPRILVYGTLLLTLVLGWGWGVTHRSMLIAEVLRDRNALFRMAQSGAVENAYTLKLVNKSDVVQRYRIRLDRPAPGLVLQGGTLLVIAGAGQVMSLPLVVETNAPAPGRLQLRFMVETVDGKQSAVVDSSFFGPLR